MLSGAVLESLQAASVSAPIANTPARTSVRRERDMGGGIRIEERYSGRVTTHITIEDPQGYAMPIDICRARLAGQFLTRNGPTTPAQVVQSLGAVQAQDYAGAKWALAQRVPSTTDAAVEAAIDAGEILRTHVLRPTWHFVAPADIRWMLALTGNRVREKMAGANRRLEIDRSFVRRSNAIFEQALAGGVSLTRAELATALSRARAGVVAGQRLAHLVMAAELDGVIISGPRRGKQFTYALLEERAPQSTPLTNEEALHQLARRYFRTRGPATPHDFAWWSGLTVADARRGIASNADALERISLGGTDYWMAADPVPAFRGRSAHLLPNYDEYFIAHRDRSAIGTRLGDISAVMGGNALVPKVIIVDGQLVGTWRRIGGANTMVVELRPRARLATAEKRHIASAAMEFGLFHGGSIEIRWT
jgi:winged helix DNA-binding protein